MIDITLIGHIGQDAQIKGTSENPFVSFSVASTEKNKNGEESTEWVNVTLNGNGGNLTQYLTKGTQVYVRGNAKVRTFQKENGEFGASLQVYSKEIKLLGRKGESQAQEPQQATQQVSTDLPF